MALLLDPCPYILSLLSAGGSNLLLSCISKGRAEGSGSTRDSGSLPFGDVCPALWYSEAFEMHSKFSHLIKNLPAIHSVVIFVSVNIFLSTQYSP